MPKTIQNSRTLQRIHRPKTQKYNTGNFGNLHIHLDELLNYSHDIRKFIYNSPRKPNTQLTLGNTHKRTMQQL